MAAPKKQSKTTLTTTTATTSPDGPGPAGVTAKVNPDGHRHAVIVKPTSVSATERQGFPVNPAFTNGGMTPNSYPYKQDWAVESGTHA